MNYKYLNYFITLLLLQSCTKPQQGSTQVNLTLPPNTASSPSSISGQQQQATAQGPDDMGGGGDTCNGKLIESYRVNLTDLPEFNEIVLPILETAFKDDSKNANKESESSHPWSAKEINKFKNWYLIDCKLDNLPKNKKGLYLETYQTAQHNDKEVFIEAESYKKLAKDEKAKLLIHEILMGLYLLKYETLTQLCSQSFNCENTKDIENISKWKMFKPEEYKPLNAEDHQNIREMTTWLWENKNSLNQSELSSLFIKNKFDKRIFNSMNNTKDEELQLSYKDLQVLFRKLTLSKNLPIFCDFISETLVAQDTCETSLELYEEKIDVKIQENISTQMNLVKLKLTSKKLNEIYFSKEYILTVFGNTQSLSTEKYRFSLANLGPFSKSGFLLAFSDRSPMWNNMLKTESHVSDIFDQLILQFDFSDKSKPQIVLIKNIPKVIFDISVQENNAKTFYFENVKNDEKNFFIEKELLMNFDFNMSEYFFNVNP